MKLRNQTTALMVLRGSMPKFYYGSHCNSMLNILFYDLAELLQKIFTLSDQRHRFPMSVSSFFCIASIQDQTFGFFHPVFRFGESTAFFSDWLAGVATDLGIVCERPILLGIFTNASVDVFLHDTT